MKRIKNIEKITASFPGWKPSTCAFIERIEWMATRHLNKTGSCEISFLCQKRDKTVSWPNYKNAFFQVSLFFEQVTAFSVRLDDGIHGMNGFDIIDISENGLEHAHFQIEDSENGPIGFFCKEIEVVSVSEKKYLYE